MLELDACSDAEIRLLAALALRWYCAHEDELADAWKTVIARAPRPSPSPAVEHDELAAHFSFLSEEECVDLAEMYSAMTRASHLDAADAADAELTAARDVLAAWWISSRAVLSRLRPHPGSTEVLTALLRDLDGDHGELSLDELVELSLMAVTSVPA